MLPPIQFPTIEFPTIAARAGARRLTATVAAASTALTPVAVPGSGSSFEWEAASGEVRAAAAQSSDPAAQGERRVDYRLPVDAPVVDPFRRPATPWGQGNRGWEFGTAGGEQVVSVGPGLVTFAGSVAGRGVVSIRHPDGLLSSVTGLASTSVARGDRLRGGEPVGAAMAGLHLGFRLDDEYVDPAVVFGLVHHAVLVPLPG